MIFLPRVSLPPKITVIVKKIGESEYEISTEPKLDMAVFGTFLVRVKQCSKNLNVKFSGGRIVLSGENPNFEAIVTCLNEGSPIPVELKVT
ncbi:MAG: hypothetical protein QXD66_00280 [Candidatus Nezhaarchaeales archaeon]|nr:MAG: hypothetical protein DSO05_01910 [Candidatus Nezhaarchaeota archaeon WYZ-LMO7]